jgi:anti-sigma-K factor RskA
MSGTQDNDPEDRDALAAEYVLGLLSAEEQARVREAAETDLSLAAAISDWTEKLEPLASLAAPSAPSDVLWARIARDMAAPQPVAPLPQGVEPFPWKSATYVGFGLAACLAIFLVTGHRLSISLQLDGPPKTMPQKIASAPPPPPLPAQLQPAPPPPKPAPPPVPPPQPQPPRQPARALALLTAPGADRPSMKAVIAGTGTVHVEALRPVQIAAGKQLDLWVWPHGEQSPTLLGRIGSDGGTLPFPYVVEDGTPMMVTAEPANLPNTGQQGPTVFAGQLALLD